jgi:hypothetical protein
MGYPNFRKVVIARPGVDNCSVRLDSKVMTVTIIIAGSTVNVVFREVFGISIIIGTLIIASPVTMDHWLEAFPAEVGSTSTLDVRTAEHFAYTCTAFWAALDLPLLQLLL